MKKFILRIFVYALLPFFAGLVLLNENQGKVYAYAPVVSKIRFLEKHPEFNLYFIGSSKINNQINSAVIDSYLPTIRSYNLGANGGFNLENYQVLREVLKNPSFKPKYIVMELQEKSKLTRTNLYSTRSFSMFDFENASYNIKYYLAEKNYPQVLLSAYSFLLNVFHFDRNPDEKEVANSSNKLVTENAGFGPLDITQKGKRVAQPDLEKEIARRLDIYISDKKSYEPNPVFVDKINALAKKCQSKNIKLILLLPGPAEPDAQRLNAYEKAFGVPVINTLNPKEFPEFYQYENRWDYGHLNEKGANIMSEIVAQKLKLYIP